MATFAVAIGNADAYGKNLSLLRPPGGRIALAPLYDLRSTAHPPEVSGPLGRTRVRTKLAMFNDDQRQIDAIDVAALRAEAMRWHLADDVDDRIHELLERFEGALQVATAAVPEAPGSLVDRLRARGLRLRNGLRPVGQTFFGSQRTQLESSSSAWVSSWSSRTASSWPTKASCRCRGKVSLVNSRSPKCGWSRSTRR